MMSEEARWVAKKGIVWIIILSIISWFLIPWSLVLPSYHSKQRTQWLTLNFMGIYVFYGDINDSLMLFEQVDEKGNYSWKVLFTPDFENNLVKVIDAFNRDPSTSFTVTEEYVRYYLTDGMHLTMGNYIVKSGGADEYIRGPGAKEPLEAYYAFRRWMEAKADLVYVRSPYYYYYNDAGDKVYVLDPEATNSEFFQQYELVPTEEPGQEANLRISNYEYIMAKHGNSIHIDSITLVHIECAVYKWEYLLVDDDVAVTRVGASIPFAKGGESPP